MLLLALHAMLDLWHAKIVVRFDMMFIKMIDASEKDRPAGVTTIHDVNMW